MHVLVDGYYTHYMADDDHLDAAKQIIYHVTAMNEIYLAEDFNGDGVSDNIGVLISGITFLDKVFGYNYLDPDKKPELFLQMLTANYRLNTVCIAMMFTFQDFGTTLGMAWVAKPSFPPRTGIGAPKNHGFVTTLLEGKKLTSRVITITLTHEVGHSFGSSHDPTPTGKLCAPTTAHGGLYIMYPTVSEANMPNNFLFSPCSKASIAVILGVRDSVLAGDESPYCGNGQVEDGEQCDCGTSMSCVAVDQCCIPSGQKNQCRLRGEQGAVCTPSTDDCCTASCQIVPELDARKCGLSDKECMLETTCDGRSSLCPVQPTLPDGTMCLQNTRICESGECKTTVCSLYSTHQCFCSAPDECKLCCIIDDQCIPLHQIEDISKNIEQNLTLIPSEYLISGSLCLNGEGFCDENQKCVKPSEALSNAIKRGEVREAVGSWLTSNWSRALLIMFVAAILLIAFLYGSLHKSESASAYRVGQLSRVMMECKRHHRMLNDYISKLNEIGLSTERGQLSIVVATSRLALMFPLTKLSEIYKLIIQSANEGVTVKKLIMLKQPMLKTSEINRVFPLKVDYTKIRGRVNEQFTGKFFPRSKELKELSQDDRDSLGFSRIDRKTAQGILQKHNKAIASKVIGHFAHIKH